MDFLDFATLVLLAGGAYYFGWQARKRFERRRSHWNRYTYTPPRSKRPLGSWSARQLPIGDEEMTIITCDN